MNLNPFELTKRVELEVKTEQWFDDEEPQFCAWEYDYADLLNTIHPDLRWTVCALEFNYQGDYFYFGELGDKYYYVVVGYGSCSGCDALQACDSYEELLQLRERIAQNIREFNSLEDFQQWFEEHGEDQWYDTSEITNFINMMKQKYNISLNWSEPY